MSHGLASNQSQAIAPTGPDGLGSRLLGARIEMLARMAAEMHAQEAREIAPGVRRDAPEPRVVRHGPTTTLDRRAAG